MITSITDDHKHHMSRRVMALCVRVALRIIVRTALPKEGNIVASQDHAAD
jgi:hypothetical protein